MSQRSESDESSMPYHLTDAQTVSAVNMVDIAYTSPSTALNQMEVEKAVARPAAIPDPAMTKICSKEGVFSRPTMERRAKIMVIQATKAAARAEHTPDMRLT